MGVITKTYIRNVFLALLVSTSCWSQQHGLLSVSFDPKMAISGPYETSEHGEMDLTIRLACYQDTYELGLYTELFPAINYYSFGLFYNYKLLLESHPKKFHNWVLPIGVEAGFIKRNSKQENLYFNFAFNGSVRYFLTKNFGLEVGVNYRYRSDLEAIYQDNFKIKANVFTGVVLVWP